MCRQWAEDKKQWAEQVRAENRWIINISARYNCFSCNTDLCDGCARKEEGKVKSANSLYIPGSRRGSTNQPLQSSSRRSSHAIHPANLPNLRRLSAISQGAQHGNASSSRKSSRCDEKCLSRRSSNIQQLMTDKNTISTSKNISISRKNSSQCINKIQSKNESIENLESKKDDSQHAKNIKNESDKIVVKALINEDKKKSLLPKTTTLNDLKIIKPSTNTLAPSMPSRRHSSSNLLQKAPVHAASRRSSCECPIKLASPTSQKKVSADNSKKGGDPD